MLKEKITVDIKAAMIAKDSEKLGVLRMLSAAIQSEEINARAKGVEVLTDEEVMKVLRREAKKREDSIKVYTDGGRPELAAGEEKELAIIKAYLPQEMTAEEIKPIVEKVIAAGNKDLGSVMKAVMAETGGRAPGKVVSEIAKQLLG